jgi:red chlorophyll catabolite reductase
MLESLIWGGYTVAEMNNGIGIMETNSHIIQSYSVLPIPWIPCKVENNIFPRDDKDSLTVFCCLQIDFMLQSSLHCKVPNGAVDITSILIFLNASTDAPHFLLDFIQGSPTSMVVILDLLPRKDLALHPEYIEKYYQNTQLDKQRENIEELPQTRPYRSTSLFVRSAWSPTAISVSIDCGQGGESILEEIVYGHLASVAKGVLQIWLNKCAGNTSEMEEAERDIMVKRDQVVRLKSIEVDLTANLPRMFGPDVSGRVITEIRKAFGVQEA